MIQSSQEPMTADERNLVRVRSNRSLENARQEFVSVSRVSVEHCYILPDFSDEYPLYLLALGDTVLILFGQWLYDPNSAAVPDALFEAWQPEESFFRDFSVRFCPDSGVVFRFSVDGDSLVAAERLQVGIRFTRLRGCQLVRGSGGTLIRDLEAAGLVAEIY